MKHPDIHRRPVALVAGVLLVLTIVHVVDHVRQGRSLDLELYGVGTVSLLAAAVTVGLAAKGHRLAPSAGIVLGIGTVIGVIAVHVAPNWWPLSDSYGDAGVDMLSWAIIIGMILVGAVLAVISLRAFAQTSPNSSQL